MATRVSFTNMTNRNTFLRLSVLLAVPTFLAVIASAQGPARQKPPTAEPAPPSVDAFTGKGMPVGHLGVPLGTVVRVAGEAIDGDTLMYKAASGKTYLRIATVNGKDLEHPVDFEFARAPKDVKKPTAGEKFDYYVHEYGHFDGEVKLPKELGIKKEMIANDGFYYRRYVTVHASNPARK
jgi:hypothetical protein